MKRLLALSARTAVWAVALLLLLCVLTDVVWEAHGVPDWAANTVRAAFAERGVSLQADRIRAGLARGITLDHARLRLRYQDLPVVVTCTELQARARLRDLFAGRIEVQAATFRGASVALHYGSAQGDGSERAAVRVERCNGDLLRRRDGVVVLTVEGLAEKIAVHLDAELLGLSAASAHGNVPGGRRVAPAPAAPEVPPREHLARVAEWLRACRLSERDAFLSGRLHIDLRNPRELSFAGEIGVSELVLGDLLVSRLKSAVLYRSQSLRFDGFTAILGQGQMATGEAVLDLDRGRLSGQVQARLLPEMLRYLPGVVVPAWLERVRTAVPIAVTATLAPSPLPPAQWRLNADVSGASIALPGLSISRLNAAVNWDGQDLTVSRWAARLGSGETESAEGRLTWHRSDGTVEGQARLRCLIAERLREAGRAGLTRALRQGEFPDPVTADLVLERSPPDWRRLRARATLTTERLRWRGRELSPLAAALEMDEASLRLTPLTVGLPGGPPDVFTLDASLDLARALESDTWDVRGEVHAQAIVNAGSGPDAATVPAPLWQEAIALHAALLYSPGAGALDVSAEGTAYPGRWYDTVVPRLGLPASGIVSDIRCAPGAPARVLLSLTRADALTPFRLTATVAAEDTRYADLVFRTIEGDLELTAKSLSFTDIKAVTTNGDDLALDLRIDFEPLAVTIRNGRVLGNPEVVATFIDDREAKAIYRRVWRDFRWDAAHAPAIDLRQLAYRETAGGRNWQLSMDASLCAEQAAYHDLPVRRLDATVLLDLPEQVEVRSARVETDTAINEGHVTILTGANPQCTFEVRQVQGGQDPARVLRLLNPEWSRELGPLVLSPESAVDCHGSFYLSREPRLQVSGSLRAPYADFYGLRVEDVTAQWRLSQAAVHWNLTSGRLFGGPFAMTGVYDVETGQGSLALRGESMVLKQLTGRFGMTGAETGDEGRVDAHCNLRLLRGWAGRPLQVYGDGFLGISQADLWRVPIFDPLGRLLDVSFLSRITGGKTAGLGRITRLDPDLGFTGDRVAIRSLTTDGTILSLRGRGEYCWETDRIALSVTGQTLDNAGIVGWIFRPLTWAFFNAELSGTSKDHKWRLSTAFSKAMPGGSGKDGELEPIPVPEP